MTEKAYVLFVDETPVSIELQEYFSQHRIKIVHQKTLYPRSQVDLLALVLDWDLVKDDPHILFNLHQGYPIPLIVVSKEKDEEACIVALELGADDFLVKPLSPALLNARILAITRRIAESVNPIVTKREVLEFGPWRLYPASRQVFGAEEKALPLSTSEYDLLYAFVQQPQSVLSREVLLRLTKSSDVNLFDRRIDIKISRLRKKIEPNPADPIFIKTLRNGGYMLAVSVIRRLLSE